MTMINLYEYITSFDFTDDISISCTIFSDIEPKRTLPKNITYLPLSEVIKNPNQITNNSIGIITKGTSKDIITLHSLLSQRPTWINLNPGLSSMISKNNQEIDDITQLLALDYQVIEPVSKKHFFSSLQSGSYLRIHDVILPETIDSLSYNFGRGVLHTKNDNNTSHIIITNPGSSEEVMKSIHVLTESINTFTPKLYIQSEFSANLSSDLIQNIQDTKNIIVILDHKATESIWMYYDVLLKKQIGLTDIVIQYIFPQFHLVSSTMPEYIYEESGFDQRSIVEQLYYYIQKE